MSANSIPIIVPIRTWRLILLIVLLVSNGLAVALAESKDIAEIDVSGFRDVIKHWNDKYGRDRKDELLTPDQVTEIADNILRFQNDDGGWPKSLHPLLKTPEPELRELLGSSLDRSTLDNRTTYTHIAYLAKAFRATGDFRYRRGAERGIDYIFAEQRSSGGWRGADVDAITFNDDVMIGVMQLLLDIDQRAIGFDWLDDRRRQQAASSLERAMDATLKCQIVVNGQRTGWCQQHSHDSFEPVQGRSYELPSICPVESSRVVRFLMQIKTPKPVVVDAIEAAVAWIRSSKIEGIRIHEIAIEPIRYPNHTSRKDRIVIRDPHGPAVWARFYEIDTNQPFFCNRDGTKVGTLAEVDHERRTGYGWYSTAPSRLIDHEYPTWKALRP